jgi:membrane-bound serine protease (ClpP class)
MEFLLNPNISYLLLMVGLLVALLALLTPGTGVLEITAVMALVLAAVLMFNLPINLWPLLLILIGAGLYVFAVLRKADPVPLAAGLLVMFVGTALVYRDPDGGLAVDPWLILVVTGLEGPFLWVVTRKMVSAYVAPPVQDLSRLLGQIGETRTIVFDEGTVYAGGEEWSARSQTKIPPNTPVRILNREGFILLVEPLPPTSMDNTDLENISSLNSPSGG